MDFEPRYELVCSEHQETHLYPFGVWHEARRGAHRGVHEFWIHGGRCHVLLVNVHPSVGPGGFGVLRPSKVNIFRHDIFRGSTPLAKGAEGVVQGLGLVGFHEN